MTQISGNVTATTLTYLTLTNGDFETGDLTGWGTGGDAWGYITSIVEVTDEDPYSGNYCASFTNVSTEDPVYITQSLDVTNVSSLIFWRKWYEDGNNVGVMTISIGDINVATYTESEDGAHTYTQKTIDVSEYTGSSTIKFALTVDSEVEPAVCLYYLDNVDFYPDVCTSATIEDNTKTWTADQLNNGMFILRSGDVTGFSTKITDTFGNYIQVGTTFANIINNINSGTSLHTATVTITNPNFSTGDFTGWNAACSTEFTGDEYATITVQSSTKYSGSYAVAAILAADAYGRTYRFTLSPTTTFDVTDIGYVSFYYNISNIVRGGDTYLQISVATPGDGEGNPVIVSETYTAVTDGWVRGLLNVATLTGEAELTIQGICPLPDS